VSTLVNVPTDLKRGDTFLKLKRKVQFGGGFSGDGGCLLRQMIFVLNIKGGVGSQAMTFGQ